MEVESISAVTFVVTDMARSLRFYRVLGLPVIHGGEDEAFTSLRVGSSYVNLQLGTPGDATRWGRAIFYVDDVDAVHAQLRDAGIEPESAPADAPWDERYFHVRDPDGHELSFARPLDAPVLRPATAADVEELHRMNQAEVPAVGSLPLDRFGTLLDIADHTVVAWLGGRIGAFIVLFGEGSSEYWSANYAWFAEREQRFAYVDRVVVAPSVRRKGLGSVLYDAAVEWAGDRPLTAEVNTRPRNETSLTFHERHGFVEVGREEPYDDGTEVAMLRRPPGLSRDQLALQRDRPASTAGRNS